MAERYRQKPEDLYFEFKSSANGLTSKQAEANAAQYGKNQITQGKKKSTLQIFLSQFADFLVIILIIAALISAITGDIESFIVIVAVITMNAILGTVQTVKAEKSLDNLKKLNSPNAKVIRNGEKIILPSEDVTVGDIVLIEAGDSVPADGRLIECASVQTNESALTGESLNVDKISGAIDCETALADRKNMVYSGSFVTYGRGKYIVTDIGMQTEVGKIAALIQSAEERKTPLQVTLDNFGKKLSIAILIICALVFGLSLWRADTVNFDSVMDSLMFAIALAVAAIPEALSSIVTIVLSFGTQKMSKENAIMRKLQAVEGLGSVSVTCSDKTGTLTQNKMTVRRIVCDGHIIGEDAADMENVGEKQLVIASVLCNDSSCRDGVDIGDPTETALIHFAHKLGLSDEEIRNSYKRISEIPFDSDRKLMSTLNVVNGRNVMYTKGAADVLVDRMVCSETVKSRIKEQVEQLSKMGLRILCFACKEFDGREITVDDEDGLEYMGLIAMMDPPREESAQAVAECKSAGIKPVMITGDHIVTASAIAKEIGILESFDEAVEGRALDDYTDEQLVDFVKDKSVYARVTPEHKIRIVKAWQSGNNIVAMTGDGVNDAPAIKDASIGVSMGISGTDVTKQAADMILLDDNFSTLVSAVREGRTIYANIRKFVRYLIACNIGEVLTMLGAIVMGMPIVLVPAQLLLVNLVTDGLPAAALSVEPPEKSVMGKPPRRESDSFFSDGLMTKIVTRGILIALFTLCSFTLLLNGGASLAQARTGAMLTLVFSQLIHVFECRSEDKTLFEISPRGNIYVILAALSSALCVFVCMAVPALAEVFSLVSPGTKGLLISLGMSAAVPLISGIIGKIKHTRTLSAETI